MSHNRSPDYNQCQCLRKAELKTKTNPNGHHSVAAWFFFYVHLDVLVATWSLPPATYSYQNHPIPQKGVQRLSRSLPAATCNYQKQ